MTTTNTTLPVPPTANRMTVVEYSSRSSLLRIELDRVRGVLDNYARLPIDKFSAEPQLLQQARREWEDVLKRYAALDAAFFDQAA